MVALAEFYADESESGKASGVSGFVFTPENAVSMHKEWIPALRGLPYFHMAEVVHRSGEFKKFEMSELSEIEIVLIELLKKYASCSFSVTIDLNHRYFLPSGNDVGLHKPILPHTFCCYWLLYNVRNWVIKNYPEAKIAYHFEAGAPHQKEINKLLNALYKDNFQREFFKIASWQFNDKKYSGAIQGADILAWNFTKNLKERLLNSGRKPRADFVSLIEDENKNFVTHFDNHVIKEFLKISSPYSKFVSRGA